MDRGETHLELNGLGWKISIGRLQMAINGRPELNMEQSS